MRKTNRNLKRIKFIRTIIVFAIIQSLFILLFCNSFRIFPENTVTISGLPDNIKITRAIIPGGTVSIGDVTRIDLYFEDLKIGLHHPHIPSELQIRDDDKIKNILSSEELYITYTEKTKVILDMYNEHVVFVTLEESTFIRPLGSISKILVGIFIEAVFCIALWFYISAEWNDVKPKKKRKISADIKNDKEKGSCN